jgi:hypothetical protein
MHYGDTDIILKDIRSDTRAYKRFLDFAAWHRDPSDTAQPAE